MKTICSETKPEDLLNICRTCLNELTTERTSIFKDIEIQTTSNEHNQDDDTRLKFRILDIILLFTSNISVNTIEWSSTSC